MNKPFHVLVVEDDEFIRECVQEVLEMEGIFVETAFHGAQALEKLKISRSLPNLILLDLNMPVMSGKEFLSKIRNDYLEYSSIPVVLMTAVPDVNLTKISGILRKPVELETIVEKVRSFR